MCSFLLTNIDSLDLHQANAMQRLRGPDLTNVIKLQGVTFVHNLLSITGAFTPQPLIGDDVAVMFNGEIYNYKMFGDFSSDGMCLLPLYEASGCPFVRELDGEFAIALLDWRKNLVFIASDVFGTKPIHYGIDGMKFGVATYSSALEKIGFRTIKNVPPNSYLAIDLKTCKVIENSFVCNFSLSQDRDDFDDWLAAFEAAIHKRTSNCREKIFIGLSSGYDSGAISCELNRQGVSYKSYSLMRNEKDGIIEQRVALHGYCSDKELIWPSAEEKNSARAHLEKNVEELYYNIYSTSSKYTAQNRLHDDLGANGLSIICRRAKADGRRIYISGQGADEIFADYGFNGKAFYPHSNFGGKFPPNLETIFPWASFFGSTQAAYLMKEEYVAGAYGIEARYPYLDKVVVQEFLRLNHNLKNWRYKSVLRKYLDDANYPCAFDEKFGFAP
jgi:asparagine synthetase B (glutamine-hydrolysing)